MACSLPLLLFLLLAVAATATATATVAPPANAPAPGTDLIKRLADGAGTQQQCWDALMEIKACTGEIIIFLINGEAYLGPGCCRAIRVIEQSCWAADAMLSAIGFTPEEGDMLKGYCDAGDEDGNGGQQQKPSPPPHASPAAAAMEHCVAAFQGGRKSSPLLHR
uniref:Prolamin-like domain-containing protein n=1 Tax=Leersia perrieri TaxID=77586 RepID=A0A0D9VSZ8_9ORYZ